MHPKTSKVTTVSQCRIKSIATNATARNAASNATSMFRHSSTPARTAGGLAFRLSQPGCRQRLMDRKFVN